MSIKPTHRTLNCERISNEKFSRLGYIRLDKNENTKGYPEGFVKDMLGSVTPRLVASYPEPFILHKRLAEFLCVPEERILLASGSDAAIKNCFETFVDRGDKVIRLDPTYAMAGVYAKLFGAIEATIGYDDELKLDYEALMKNIREGAKLIYIANPNSPTGTVMETEQIREVCKEAVKKDAVVMVDEAYYYFHSSSAITLLGEFENLLITRSFSKAAGLASVRLGYIVASQKIIKWLSRWRPMYEINSFAQHCGCFILDHWDQVEEYVKEVIISREWFAEQVGKIGLRVFVSHANFLLVKYPIEKINKTLAEFKNEGILIKGGGNCFPLSETLRFSIGSRPQMGKCVEILKNLNIREL